jgi:hypothetical protein
MKKLTIALLSLLIAVPAAQAEGMKMSHAHMGHVLSGWKDTPNQAGLLPVALAEAQVAAQHADFAASKPSDLGWMKTHSLHVMHALDPSLINKGPGAGYGVIKAANGVSQHIGFAAASSDASDAVKLHAVHVATTAQNSVARAQEMLQLAQQVLDTGSVEQAAARVAQVRRLAHQLLDGVDANGDGTVSWQKGEGGLEESAKHMGFMAKAEGMM